MNGGGCGSIENDKNNADTQYEHMVNVIPFERLLASIIIIGRHQHKQGT